MVGAYFFACMKDKTVWALNQAFHFGCAHNSFHNDKSYVICHRQSVSECFPIYVGNASALGSQFMLETSYFLMLLWNSAQWARSTAAQYVSLGVVDHHQRVLSTLNWKNVPMPEPGFSNWKASWKVLVTPWQHFAKGNSLTLDLSLGCGTHHVKNLAGTHRCYPWYPSWHRGKRI